MPDVPWLLYVMLLAPLGLLLFAASYKTLQVRAVSDWPSAPGKVVTSNSEVREVGVIDRDSEDGHRTEARSFANIVYEYSVSGQTLRNNRVSIGEDRGNFEVAETIARYPVGTAVTVFYNPRHPREAVLERDLPKGLWGCLGIGTAIVLTGLFGSAFGLHQLTEFLSARLANPMHTALVVFIGVFGAGIALFALALQRQASLAKKWPVVPGTIETSDIEQYRAALGKDFSRGQEMYRRQVSYGYTYNDVSYTNVHANLGGNVASNSSWLVRKFTAGYQHGVGVNVYVNPANPSEATLNPRASFVWLLWLVALGLWLGAYLIAQAA